MAQTSKAARPLDERAFWLGFFGSVFRTLNTDKTWVWIREPKPGDMRRCRERLESAFLAALRDDATQLTHARGARLTWLGTVAGHTIDDLAVAMGIGDRAKAVEAATALIDLAVSGDGCGRDASSVGELH